MFPIVPKLEELLKTANADKLTDDFGLVLVFIFIISLLFFIFQSIKPQKKFFSNLIEYSPVLLTSVGILGTFTGIVAGLLNFDINNIDTSISSLLGGMKTAFLSSVIGVALSILLKIIYSFPLSKQANNQKLDVQSLVGKFYEQAEHTKKQSDHIESLTKAVDQLTVAIGSNTDSSLLSQLKLLRSDLSDNNKITKEILENGFNHIEDIRKITNQSQMQFMVFEDHLWKKLNDFAEMMSKSATQQVIEALKQVISDFNNNLIEQFGDNFKQLNLAVLSLIEWQENYKNQLNEMIKLYNSGVKTLSDTEKSITHIEQSTQEIPKTMNNLSQIITANQHQIQELDNHLTAFAELKDKAVNAVPQIQSQIELMLSGVSEGNKKLIEGIAESGEKLNQNLNKGGEELYKNVNEVSEGIKNSSNVLLNKNQEIQQTFTTMQDAVYSTFEKLLQQHIFQAEKTLANIENNTKKTLEGIAESGEKLNQNLNKGGEELYKNVNEVSEGIKNSSNALLNKNKEIQREFEQLQITLHKTFEELMRTHISENSKLMRRLEEEGKNALNITAESVTKQLKLIDESMQSEVNRVMNEMGRALATISRQFTDDYKKLVNEMHNITSYRNRG
ncbi:hypothetical protein A6B43_06865 [Vespertiliibacter pulmonis]|uniref:MotA/TolQ/ExbB proton channel family protein n=1 Tax=Vespertiliibacter pulmonis TaxID=1443036 RepID=A0A3N4VRD2_9PAST|nr:MotA/TolQ/ExbB proton channel family protein [Vespertiliibacter pulmonis]QLB21256.1 hypothetical protein A6B43_06865 [Vespertiliibacter pulmonis]RPE85662.1 MotA/TolQ/ExbB proton channel family protein [Vespertiliibacter pulmonis]